MNGIDTLTVLAIAYLAVFLFNLAPALMPVGFR